MRDIQNEIKELVESNNVVLFMKGTPEMPQCGFSSVVAGVLRNMQVTFIAKNILEDAELREGIKIYSDWPTIPQLYIKAEFIGGCDIVRELKESGELEQILTEKNIEFSTK